MKKFFLMLMSLPMFFACSSSVSLKGDWQVVSAYGVSTEGAMNQPFISFQDSGKVTGNAGVNSFFGEYNLKGDALSFGNMGMTRMMGPNMEIEDAVTKALNSAATFQANGDQIIVRDAEGNEAMVIKKK